MTHRPRLDGTQIGIVAGPAGEEIHTDEYGRVKLWFPWDRRATKDGSDTCWVRVIQSWGGGGWGAQVIPRIGMEAMVTYLDGDPDRPVVVGLVPNPHQRVPYSLPEQKTRMVMRSKSHKSQGANEQTFEDATGRENYFEHAQKDRTGRVLNNHTHRVDANAVTSVGQNHAVEVAGHQNLETGGSQNNVVGATGPAVQMVMAALTPLLTGTAGLAHHAVSTASSFVEEKGSLPEAMVPKSPPTLGGIGGLLGSAVGGGGLMGTLMPVITQGASALMSLFGHQGRAGVVAGSSPVADAGDQLRNAGAQMAEQGVGSLFGGMSGVQNNLVTSARNTNIGAMDVQTVGETKVLNVGHTYFTNVGGMVKLEVGSRYEIGVGEAIFSKTGKHVMVAGDKIVLAAPGGEIEINKDGIIIKGKRVEIQGQQILLTKGDGGCKANSTMMEE